MNKQSNAAAAHHYMQQQPGGSSGNRSSLGATEFSSGFGSLGTSPTSLQKTMPFFGQNNFFPTSATQASVREEMQQQQQPGTVASDGNVVSTTGAHGRSLIMRPVRQPSLSQAPPDQLYYTQIQQAANNSTPRRSSLVRQGSDALSVFQQQQQQQTNNAKQQQFAVVGRRQSRNSVLNEEQCGPQSPALPRRSGAAGGTSAAGGGGGGGSTALMQQALFNDSKRAAAAAAAGGGGGALANNINNSGGARQGSVASDYSAILLSKFTKQPPAQLQPLMLDNGGGNGQAASEEDDEPPEVAFPAFEKFTYADLIPYNQTSIEPTREFLREAVELMLQYLKSEGNREQKVLNFKHPIKMLQTFDFSIPQTGFPLSQILYDMKETLNNAVRTGHPRFFNQLSTGKEIVSLVGDWLTSTTNSNMFTYEISPVYVIMEAEVLRHMREIIGWSDGEGDGIFAPGGTISNLYAVIAARHKKFPQCKQRGMSVLPARLVMFTSEQSHYSIRGAASITGIGTSNVVEVHADERGKMLPAELEREVRAALDRGDMPFFVNATAGTTVMGAYDPLHEIADICDKYDLWLHVDGAWGAGCLMSPKLRHLADGIERADSVTWNPHKLMGTLLQCSAILLREPGLLFSCNQMCADYLYQQDKHYDVKFDTGDRAIQCGRHVDIFKLWLMWRAFGDNGFAARVEHLWAMRDYMVRALKSRQDFWILLEEPECTNVCFWYIPPSLADVPRTPRLMEKLGKIIPVIKARMMDRGTMMIGYQPASGKPNFFRAVISNAAVGIEDIDFLIEEIVELGKDM